MSFRELREEKKGSKKKSKSQSDKLIISYLKKKETRIWGTNRKRERRSFSSPVSATRGKSRQRLEEKNGADRGRSSKKFNLTLGEVKSSDDAKEPGRKKKKSRKNKARFGKAAFRLHKENEKKRRKVLHQKRKTRLQREVSKGEGRCEKVV